MNYFDTLIPAGNRSVSFSPIMPPSTEQLLNRLRLRQIALLLAIDEHTTLRAAAACLGMTQPAASKMLRELEEAIGTALCERVGRGLRFTPAGRTVLHTCRGLRSSLASLNRELAELPLGDAGKLLVGCITAVSPTPLSEVALQLKKCHPRLSIEIHVDTSDRLIKWLLAGRLDLVIGRMPEGRGQANRDCLFQPIGEEALSVVAARHHPLAANDSQPLVLADLQPYPWLLQLQGSPLREVIEREFRSHHLSPPQGLVETSSFLTAIGIVAESETLAVVPRSIAEAFARRGLLRILPYTFKHTLSPWGCLTYRHRTLSPIMREFLEHLRDAHEAMAQ